MLALRIIATIFMGLSALNVFCRNIDDYRDERYGASVILLITLVNWGWRALVIVALWVI